MPKAKNNAGRATLKETSKKEREIRIGKDKQNPNQTAGINPNRSITELTVNMLKAFIFKSNIISIERQQKTSSMSHNQYDTYSKI